MSNNNMPNKPSSKTKEDAYKLAMLAAQLERLNDGRLNLHGAYDAWKDSIRFVAEQYQDKQEEGIRFDSIDIKIYPLKEALEQMEISPQNWKNTFRKKFNRLGMGKEDIDEALNRWVEVGVFSYEIIQFRNEKAKPIPGLDD